MKHFVTLIITLFCFSANSIAQNAEMADGMRSSGKIYVVVGVIVLIFAVLFTYLIMIDRRLRKLENSNNKK